MLFVSVFSQLVHLLQLPLALSLNVFFVHQVICKCFYFPISLQLSMTAVSAGFCLSKIYV